MLMLMLMLQRRRKLRHVKVLPMNVTPLAHSLENAILLREQLNRRSHLRQLALIQYQDPVVVYDGLQSTNGRVSLRALSARVIG